MTARKGLRQELELFGSNAAILIGIQNDTVPVP
jgi:hypothetical protein